MADIDRMVHDALARIGAFIRADRVFVVDYDFDEGVYRVTHEWDAAG